MTKREEKQRLKREQRLKAEKAIQQKTNRNKKILQVFRTISFLIGIGFFILSILTEKLQILCIVGASWFWTIGVWLNWILAPQGTSASVCQFGKSGLLKVTYTKNLTVAIVFSAVTVVLTLIILYVYSL